MSFGVSPVLVPRWPDVASVAQLPNVAGALVQSDGVRVNDLCVVTGMGYFVCTTRTPGAAVWAPLGSVANRASSSSNTPGTIATGVTLQEYTAAAGAITPALPANMPIGFVLEVVLASANADGLTLSAPGGGTIQGAASLLLPGSDAAPPTTADRAWQLRVTAANTWRLA